MQNTEMMQINGKSHPINYPVVSSQLSELQILKYRLLNHFLKVYNTRPNMASKYPYIFHQPKVASVNFVISFHIAQKSFAKLSY